MGRVTRATILSRNLFVNQMFPRNYDMSKRAAAAAQTRRRIVDATLELHAERGIAATRWDDIAARAGVGVGTVYRHFPSLDELIPACGEAAKEVIAFPEAPPVFDGLRARAERIERLVREVFAVYERGAPVLRTILEEAEAHPRVAQDAAAIEASLSALVDTALEPLDVTPRARAVTRAMVDLGTWQALRGQGLSSREAVETVSRMLTGFRA